MLQFLVSPATFTLLTLTFVFSLSVAPFVLAQNFRPQPNYSTCSAHTEGQGLYVLGGVTKENFILDLSVSWNTSDPVFREITNGPRVDDMGACVMTNNGEDLFVLTKGTGYVYNVKSNSWRVFHNANFGTTGHQQSAATDPETGFIYLATHGMNFAGEKVVVSLDLKSNTVNTTASNSSADWSGMATWSAYLKSILFMAMNRNPYMFTPSDVNAVYDGWDTLKLTRVLPPGTSMSTAWNCGAAAYNGTKLFHIGMSDGRVYTMDVIKRTWTRGPVAPITSGSACAISGDYFIVWGGYDTKKLSGTNNTYVFNTKTEKWVSRYIAPPPRPTTTTHASQTPTQPTSYTSDSDNASSNDMKLVAIIVIVTGILMAIILGVMFRYHRRTRQVNSCGQRTSPDGSSTDSLDVKVGDSKTPVKELSVGSSRQQDPPDSGTDTTDHLGQHKWYTNGLLGRIHQGPLGARPLSEHLHATMEDPTTKRNVQEGALEV